MDGWVDEWVDLYTTYKDSFLACRQKYSYTVVIRNWCIALEMVP